MSAIKSTALKSMQAILKWTKDESSPFIAAMDHIELRKKLAKPLEPHVFGAAWLCAI